MLHALQGDGLRACKLRPGAIRQWQRNVRQFDTTAQTIRVSVDN